MANKFLLKRSNVAGSVPPAGSLVDGELGINTRDGSLFARMYGGQGIKNIIQQRGVFIPTLETTSAGEPTGFVYATRVGWWARTGNVVSVQGDILLSGVPSPMPISTLWISGFPYSFSATGAYATVHDLVNVTSTAALVGMVGSGSPAGTQYRMKVRARNTTTNGYSDVGFSSISATSAIRFVSIYRTEDVI